MHKISMLPQLSKTIKKVRKQNIPAERQKTLQPLIDFIQHKLNSGLNVNLNFICTHNSRRSQFAEIWAQTAAAYFGIPAHCFSGGVEVTAFNERAVASLKRSGFRISGEGDHNPVYSIIYADDREPIQAFSKLFDDQHNKKDHFAAVMTCAQADDNCPFIPGAEKRIAVRYYDPKEFDDTSKETKKYDERSLQIASEMFYVFSQIKNNL